MAINILTSRKMLAVINELCSHPCATDSDWYTVVNNSKNAAPKYVWQHIFLKAKWPPFFMPFSMAWFILFRVLKPNCWHIIRENEIIGTKWIISCRRAWNIVCQKTTKKLFTFLFEAICAFDDKWTPLVGATRSNGSCLLLKILGFFVLIVTSTS